MSSYETTERIARLHMEAWTCEDVARYSQSVEKVKEFAIVQIKELSNPKIAEAYKLVGEIPQFDLWSRYIKWADNLEHARTPNA